MAYGMKNIFEGVNFEWINKIPTSDYVNAFIKIEGLYGWGDGYYNQRTYNAFHNEVYNALKAAGYSFKPKEFSSACDYLVKEGTSLNLYMHPMEFTGSATREQIEEIVDILKSSTSLIKNVTVIRDTPLLDLSDRDFRNYIYNDAEKIASILLNNGDIKHNVYADFDFGEAISIDRIQKPSTGGRSSSDVDVSAVNDIRVACIELLDKKVKKSEIPKQVAEMAKVWSREIDLITEEIKVRTAGLSNKELMDFFDVSHVREEKIREYLQKNPITELSAFLRIAEKNGFKEKVEVMAEKTSSIDFMNYDIGTASISDPNYAGKGHITSEIYPSEEGLKELIARSTDIKTETIDMDDYRKFFDAINAIEIAEANGDKYPVYEVRIFSEINHKEPDEKIGVVVQEFNGETFIQKKYDGIELSEAEKGKIISALNEICMELKGKSYEDVVLDIRLGAERVRSERIRDDYTR